MQAKALSIKEKKIDTLIRKRIYVYIHTHTYIDTHTYIYMYMSGSLCCTAETGTTL